MDRSNSRRTFTCRKRQRSCNKDQGEVFVDPTTVRPYGYAQPVLTSLDLSNKTITASIRIPDKLVGKDLSKPPYAQLFLEDCSPSSKRHTLHSRVITTAGQLDLVQTTDNSVGRICLIGIKIGLNPEDHNVYVGEVYIDVVDW